MATLETLDLSAGFAADLVQATEADAVTGYRRFHLGAFAFQRDEYFVKSAGRRRAARARMRYPRTRFCAR